MGLTERPLNVNGDNIRSMADAPPKRPRKRSSGSRPARSRAPAKTTHSHWLRLTVIVLIVAMVFAAALILDTGALLQLFWLSLLGQLGLGARLVAAFIAIVLLLPPSLAAWHKLRGPSVPGRTAPKKKAGGPRKAVSKTGTKARTKKGAKGQNAAPPDGSLVDL